MKLLLYCTKGILLQWHFKKFLEKPFMLYPRKAKKEDYESPHTLNGKIVAECDFEVQSLERIGDYIRFAGVEDGEWLNNMYYEYKSCLSEEELFNYVKDKFYAIHIKNLNIFDKPRELSDYCKEEKIRNSLYSSFLIKTPIKNAPQNMMYCYGKKTGEKYILISIRPEWLCKILNGEKTIEIRKKVLKEMQL